MRALELDLYRARAAAPWAGWLLLAVALFFLADVGASLYRLRQSVEAHEARLAHLEGPAAAAARLSASRQTVSAEEMALARDTIARLSLPWDSLFGALEQAAMESIALLALEPDREAGTILVRGEARDYASVLDYVQALQRSKALSQVHLVKHEVLDPKSRAGSPNALGFAISARWKEPAP